MLLGTSPLRLSFAGGGTDLKEYYENFEGSVVSTAINHFTYVIVTPRQDNSFQIFSSDFQLHFKPTKYNDLKPERGSELAVTVIKSLDYDGGANLMCSSEVAPGSGLGASSSLTVGLLCSLFQFKEQKVSKNKLAQLACDIEISILGHPIGKQDQYAAAYGGFNRINFDSSESVEIIPLKIDKNFKFLEISFLLIIVISFLKYSNKALFVILLFSNKTIFFLFLNPNLLARSNKYNCILNLSILGDFLIQLISSEENMITQMIQVR